MGRCEDCACFKVYRGTTDRYGVPQEPDECECTSERVTEEELDRFFSDGQKWQDEEDACSGFIYSPYDESW